MKLVLEIFLNVLELKKMLLFLLESSFLMVFLFHTESLSLGMTSVEKVGKYNEKQKFWENLIKIMAQSEHTIMFY